MKTRHEAAIYVNCPSYHVSLVSNIEFWVETCKTIRKQASTSRFCPEGRALLPFYARGLYPVTINSDYQLRSPRSPAHYYSIQGTYT